MTGWALAVLGVLCACGLFIIVRLWRLSTLRYSFRALLRTPGGQWRRGFACYGATNMAWYSLVRFAIAPDLLLPRTTLEVVGKPVQDHSEGTTTLWLQSGDDRWELVVSTGDYTGLLSWIDSNPPSESREF
ncbi:DUF2550 family protein [Actinomycetaceae bacterium WB03_NA08]|uniref:DUF2550 family protein n=1 Tax=Scrofimicrobium canadense TaxID=2652290 RepID=A0A6N7W8A8_9ACTO|nr:DUF2550 family protein [Scrofimicrobium canadense]MSS84743.1 DUF2550 family protein [Scrofimicrobium canadense]